jgi:uncharacterized protein YndB with AHSA1/START domain
MTYEQKVTLTGSPDQVFAALTDAAQLRKWFAEHVDVEPKVDGKYRFWGKHTYGVPKASDAQQRITAFEPAKRLAFSWRFEGLDSVVSYELAPEDPSSEPVKTTLALRHALPSPPSVPYSAELVEDMWRFILGNLNAHLEGGIEVLLPDFADPRPSIKLSIVINAPRERVFRALTEPATMNRWISQAAEVDLREGGRFSYGWKYKYAGNPVDGGPTKILELVPNERLVTDWPDWRGDATRPPTRVTWLLEDAERGTRVTLIHDGFSRAADQGDYPFGWFGFLDRLRSEAEGGNAGPMPSIEP